VITGDRGFCGGYNSNLAEFALRHMPETEDEMILAVGNRGRDFFRRRVKRIIRTFAHYSETARYEDARHIIREAVALYENGMADTVHLYYTRYVSVLSCVPTVRQLLPLNKSDAPPPYAGVPMAYEGDPSEYINRAVPICLAAGVYEALLESAACEQATRMVSMDAATKNADEIIEQVTRVYNRKRQALITQEINEIVGGIEVIK
jgi:F-type H+-transporting ATPase subunit gamma